MLYLSGSKVPRNLKEIHKYEFADREEIERLKEQKLTDLLIHSYNNVPYYSKLLREYDVVDENGNVKLENFPELPLLTKDIIRKEGENLYSKDHKSRRSYKNTSGGSTGEPVEFIQDCQYDDWNIATKLYFNMVLGKEPGDSEIKFWGSDRDIIKGNLTLKDRMINFLYNRKFFNSYQLDDNSMSELIQLNNRFKPATFWSYMESALELTNFLEDHKQYFHPPKILISTIGPLTNEVKEKIESQLKCRVYNQYGSREVGVIACQCKEQKGLHTFPWWNLVEILNEKNEPVKNEEGDVVVTTFYNYSMPLIRYNIGDVAIASEDSCSCRRNTLVLKKILGRTLGYFKKSDSSLVHSHFLVQSLFFRDWLKRFQIIQDRLDHILIKLELREDQTPPKQDIEDITAKTKLLMGNRCQIDFETVDTIKRTVSGKYVYTLCKVK